MTSTRYRWLFGVALLLAGLRFLIVPWMQFQSVQSEQLQALTAKLDRSQSLKGNGEIIERTHDRLVKDVESIRGRFPEASDAQGFKLDAQRQLNQIASSIGLKVTLFDWLIDGKEENSGLAYGRAKFRIEGSLRDVIRLHGEIEGQLRSTAVREFDLELQSPASGPGLDGAAATFTVDLYYWVAPAAAVGGGSAS